MSEESISLKLLKRAVVKQSTPKEESIYSENMLSLSNLFPSLSPLPKKLIQVSPPFQNSLEGLSSQYSKRAYETMTIRNREPSTSSRIMFRRRLSTIMDSEENTVISQEISPFLVISSERSSICSDAQSNEGLIATTKATKSEQATIFKESVTKRRKKSNMKQRTPKEESICSKNTLSLSNSFASLSPLPNKLIQVSPPFENSPEGLSSQYPKRAYETMTIRNREPSTSSRIIFRRKLSTIMDSEENTVISQEIRPFPVMSNERSCICSDAQSNEGLIATTKPPKSEQKATIFKESVTKRRKKNNMKKMHVKERVRQWELRQLKNIEEATTHELTIE